jgi:hypothetical protein
VKVNDEDDQGSPSLTNAVKLSQARLAPGTRWLSPIEDDIVKNYPISYYVEFIGRRISNMGYYMQYALKLDKVFCCRQCTSVFLFESDVEDHAEMCGHRDILEIDL